MPPNHRPAGSVRTYWRFSIRHKWHVRHGWRCSQFWVRLTDLDYYDGAQICEDMRETRPPGEFCKACFRVSHAEVAETIEDCR